MFKTNLYLLKKKQKKLSDSNKYTANINVQREGILIYFNAETLTVRLTSIKQSIQWYGIFIV